MRAAAVLAALGFAWAGAAAGAELRVGVFSEIDFGSGRLQLGCGDLVVSGIVRGGSGVLSGIRDVTIDVPVVTSGTLHGESATFEVAGDWTNLGTFNGGTSSVIFVDGCGRTTSTLSGDTAFASLSLTSQAGKTFFFEAGSTQTIAGQFAVGGVAGSPIQIRSTVDGNMAFTDLQGFQSGGQYVDVKDNDAIGKEIFLLSPGSANSGNADRWTVVLGVPALPVAGGALLALALLWAGRRARAVRRVAG